MIEQRDPRQRDENYLAWLRTLPCCICQDNTSTEAAHLRLGQVNVKREAGMGEKPSDRWALPLCHRHHVEQHAMNESAFWLSYGLDPFALCMHYQERRDV